MTQLNIADLRYWGAVEDLWKNSCIWLIDNWVGSVGDDGL